MVKQPKCMIFTIDIIHKPLEVGCLVIEAVEAEAIEAEVKVAEGMVF